MSDGVVSLGLDFGTESVRALLVDLAGRELTAATAAYAHGQITDRLPTTGQQLPPHFALQHPADWLDASADAVRRASASAGIRAEQVAGVGVDFTSCTMLPARRDGTPLCLADGFGGRPLAWPKLWKHHGAGPQAERINLLARQRGEPWLDSYGGVIGLEWFFPKILETLEGDEGVYDATDVWLEAGDWYVWRLVGGDASAPPRSTCQAGYKAMWNAATGYPSRDFFAALHPKLADVVADKLPGRFGAPGTRAGGLCGDMAARLGLAEGTPVSVAIIDAHAGAVGAGAAEGTLVMVMGTSSCHMLNAAEYHRVPGVAGVVRDGILPGYYGYETGQAAVGDAFDWARRLLGGDFATLTRSAAALPPGADGVLCVDWFHGSRTPLMDGSLRGGFVGLSLGHGPAHVYRAVLEASAYGLRWIAELLRSHGVPVRKYVATGGLPHHNPLLVQVCADVLGEPVEVHPSTQGPALGAAILGALAAGPGRTGFADAAAAVNAMSSGAGPSHLVRPDRNRHAEYTRHYGRYRRLCDLLQDDAARGK